MGGSVSAVNDNVSVAYNWTNVICNTLFIVSTLVIIAFSVKQDTFKHLPKSLKVCLIGFFIAYVSFNVSSIEMVVTDTHLTQAG